MRPEPIHFASASSSSPSLSASLPCPACSEPLEDDPDGTSCDQCGGLLVARVWAERCRPAMGRAALPPVFVAAPKELPCPACRQPLGPVLCHGVAAWSCARCRWLFFEGLRRRQLDDPRAPVAVGARELPRASLVQVLTDGARQAPGALRDAMGLVLLAAIVLAAIMLEGVVG
jgi:hypothetical protein